MGRPGKRVIEDGLFNIGSDLVLLRTFTTGKFVELALNPIGLVISVSFVALLTAVVDEIDEITGFADVIELFGEL